MGKLNKYVRVEGHNNWFLVLEPDQKEPKGLTKDMSERLFRKTVLNTLHKNGKNEGISDIGRIAQLGILNLDYERIAKDKNKTLLIRPIGSYMFLEGSEVIDEKYSEHFPVYEYGDIVITENDYSSESKWVDYLKKRFPNKSIKTMNYFDLMPEKEIIDYFKNAEYVTFSTTFSNFEWYRKLKNCLQPHNKVIGYSHDPDKWSQANEIYNNLEIIDNI